MLEKVWEFVKNPLYVQEHYDFNEQIRIFLRLVLITVGFSMVLGVLTQGITASVGFKMENHAVMEMMEEYSALMVLLLAVVIAPILEELFFRAPLVLFKDSHYFKYAFYTSIVLFGIVHISNFGSIDNFYLLVPFLIAPQISAGIFLGYIRVQLGLLWSILLHAAHNLILIGPFILMKLLGISFE